MYPCNVKTSPAIYIIHDYDKAFKGLDSQWGRITWSNKNARSFIHCYMKVKQSFTWSLHHTQRSCRLKMQLLDKKEVYSGDQQLYLKEIKLSSSAVVDADLARNCFACGRICAVSSSAHSREL